MRPSERYLRSVKRVQNHPWLRTQERFLGRRGCFMEALIFTGKMYKYSGARKCRTVFFRGVSDLVQHKMHVKWLLVKKSERWGYIVQELAFLFKEFVPEMIRCTVLHWEFDPWVWQFFNSTQLNEMKQRAEIKCENLYAENSIVFINTHLRHDAFTLSYYYICHLCLRNGKISKIMTFILKVKSVDMLSCSHLCHLHFLIPIFWPHKWHAIPGVV